MISDIHSSGWLPPWREFNTTYYRRYFDHARASATISIPDDGPIHLTLGVDSLAGRVLCSFPDQPLPHLADAIRLAEQEIPDLLVRYPRVAYPRVG